MARVNLRDLRETLFVICGKKLPILRSMRLKLLFVFVFITGCFESKEVRLQKFLLKGNLAVKEQNLDQAAYYFKEALHLDPCFADAANNLGTLYFKQKHWEQALDQYEKAIQCKPGFLNAYFNRANTFYELKTYYGALGDLNRVIQEKPDTAIAYFI